MAPARKQTADWLAGPVTDRNGDDTQLTSVAGT